MLFTFKSSLDTTSFNISSMTQVLKTLAWAVELWWDEQNLCCVEWTESYVKPTKVIMDVVQQKIIASDSIIMNNKQYVYNTVMNTIIHTSSKTLTQTQNRTVTVTESHTHIHSQNRNLNFSVFWIYLTQTVTDSIRMANGVAFRVIFFTSNNTTADVIRSFHTLPDKVTTI